jgi:hypothetical protein
VGELWVSYEIDLIRPKLFAGVANLGLSAHFSFTGGTISVTNGMNNFTGLFTGLTPAAGSDLPVVFGNNTVTIPGWVSGVVLMYLTGTFDGGTVTGGHWAPTATVNSGSANFLGMFAAGASFSGPYSDTTSNPGTVNQAWTFHLSGTSPSTPVVLGVRAFQNGSGAGTALFAQGDAFVTMLGVSN